MMDIIVKVIIGVILGMPALIAWFYGLFLFFTGDWDDSEWIKGIVLIGFGFITGLFTITAILDKF